MIPYDSIMLSACRLVAKLLNMNGNEKLVLFSLQGLMCDSKFYFDICSSRATPFKITDCCWYNILFPKMACESLQCSVLYVYIYIWNQNPTESWGGLYHTEGLIQKRLSLNYFTMWKEIGHGCYERHETCVAMQDINNRQLYSLAVIY